MFWSTDINLTPLASKFTVLVALVPKIVQSCPTSFTDTLSIEPSKPPALD